MFLVISWEEVILVISKMMLAKEKSHLKQNTRKQLLLEILHVKVVQHLQFHFVRIGSAQNQTMQRLAEIHFTKLLQRSEADKLIRLSDTRQTHRQRVRSTHYPSMSKMDSHLPSYASPPPPAIHRWPGCTS